MKYNIEIQIIDHLTLTISGSW